MAFALDKQATLVTGGGTNPTISFPSLPAAGALVVVPLSGYDFAGTPTVSDNQGNGNYTIVEQEDGFNGSSHHLYLAYKENIGSPSGTFTVTVAESGYYAIGMTSWTGAPTSSVVRDSGSAQGNSTPTAANASTDGSAGLTGDLVIAACSVAISGDTDVGFGANAATGYTALDRQPNYSATMSLAVDYKIATGDGSQSAAWTHDDTSSGGWGALIAVFKAAAGGGSIGFDDGDGPVFLTRLRPATTVRLV